MTMHCVVDSSAAEMMLDSVLTELGTYDSLLGRYLGIVTARLVSASLSR